VILIRRIRSFCFCLRRTVHVLSCQEHQDLYACVCMCVCVCRVLCMCVCECDCSMFCVYMCLCVSMCVCVPVSSSACIHQLEVVQAVPEDLSRLRHKNIVRIRKLGEKQGRQQTGIGCIPLPNQLLALSAHLYCPAASWTGFPCGPWPPM